MSETVKGTDIHCVSKIDTDVARYNFNIHQKALVIFAEMLLREIVSFQSCWPTTQQAFSSDVALLRIAQRTVVIVLQVDWRCYSEHLHLKRRQS